MRASSSSRLLVYLFLFSGRSRSPPRNRSFSVFAWSIGRCKYVFILISSSNPPRIFLSLPMISPCFLALAFPFFVCSFHFCLVPPKLVCGHHLFLVSSYILLHFLDCTIPPYFSAPFSSLSPIQLYQLPLEALFFGTFHTWYFILPVQLFSRPYLS